MKATVRWKLKREERELKNGKTTRKLKCNDGIIREFYTSSFNKHWGEWYSTECCNCGCNWGVHSFNSYKEELKKHDCKIKSDETL